MSENVMTDSVNLLQRAERVDVAPLLDGYTGVELMVSDDQYVFAGDRTGRVMTAECPLGNQQVAENILARIRAYQYQPIEIQRGLMNPAAELMDSVTADGIYAGIYGQRITFGPQFEADVSAPYDEEINHEYPYQSQEQRKVQRRFGEAFSELRINADAIAAEVTAREADSRELRSSLKVQAGQISAKVSKSGGEGGSFSWEMEWDHHRWTANGREVFRLDASGAKVTGEIRATSGEIGGFQILRDRLSYNNQEWGGTNSRGGYFGPSGIQLGPWDEGFHVDMRGHIFAQDGEFRGSIRAGRIEYGGDNGYMSGHGLISGSVTGGYGGAIGGGAISTFNTSGGINASLGNADYASDVVRGYQTAMEMSCNKMEIVSNLKFRGSYVYIVTINGKKVLGIG